ncbi:GAF domain-containing protein [Novosphingobium album (ex Liu et al. 2023)]|uniref:GAF domain-containing protein n=1 Tax=Novosphingobium album (ex Liu et al. 2023) TaxID=3031130 RepID=A0ABT5WP05_9SPHN|nr:GAF domain-containing protein [Novosphingobium album (ex Liu et al. 2023)]MDE8651785.1 GAF domain-containing protein [Novosphingobium album (ex Liu et al. 2023)]
MFDFAADPDQPKPMLYNALARAADALVEGERDTVANMANIAALIWQFVPRLNWAGFYRAVGDELVLGPFIGKPACIRIPFGRGVCGTAAATGATQLVADVHAFPGHIACDADSRSELVVPVLAHGKVIAVIDLDSPEPARFDEADAAGIEWLAQVAARAI